MNFIKQDKNENERKSSNILKVIKGSVISILISVVLLFIASLILTYTNIGENAIPTLIIIISAISIFIGSLISTMHIKQRGILNGSMVGAIYIIIIYLFSSIAITGFNMNIKSLIMLVASVIAGTIGGIVGVNL